MKSLFHLLSLILLWSLLSHTPAAAQTTEPPEAVAQAYLDASRKADWEKIASLMHPDALKQLRGLFAPLFALSETEKSLGFSEFLIGVKTKAEFDQMSNAAVFQKLFGGIFAGIPGVKEALSASAFDLLGSVQEKPDTLHFVFRANTKFELPNLREPIPFNKLDVMTLRRFENTWRVDLKGDIEMMMKALLAGIQSAKERTQTTPTTIEPPVIKQPAAGKPPAGKQAGKQKK